MEGQLLESNFSTFIVTIVNTIIETSKTEHEQERICSIGYFKVDPSTICQCTGLRDKNGKLIWENDIVRIVYNGIEHVYKVIWDVSELDFKATNGEENYESNFQYLMSCDEIEVIGSAINNPELVGPAERLF